MKMLFKYLVKCCKCLYLATYRTKKTELLCRSNPRNRSPGKLQSTAHRVTSSLRARRDAFPARLRAGLLAMGIWQRLFSGMSLRGSVLASWSLRDIRAFVFRRQVRGAAERAKGGGRVGDAGRFGCRFPVRHLQRTQLSWLLPSFGVTLRAIWLHFPIF